jgi:hypothetical protein
VPAPAALAISKPPIEIGTLSAGAPVDRDAARVAAGVVARHAGQELHELADRAVGDGAELVGGDDLHDVAREALLVDRDGGAVHFLRGRDLERVELHHGIAAGRAGLGAASEGDVARDALPRDHRDNLGVDAEASVEERQFRRPRRQAREAILAGGIGEGDERGALGVTRAFSRYSPRRGSRTRPSTVPEAGDCAWTKAASKSAAKAPANGMKRSGGCMGSWVDRGRE